MSLGNIRKSRNFWLFDVNFEKTTSNLLPYSFRYYKNIIWLRFPLYFHSSFAFANISTCRGITDVTE